MRTTSAIGSEAATRHGRAAARSGFTLIELSIALFIIAMMVALAIPKFVRSYNSWLVTETARAFTITCQYARIQAVTRQQPAVLHIDLERQIFWVTQSVPNEDGAAEEQTLKAHELSNRVIIASVEQPDLSQKEGEKLVNVAFYPNGTCDAVTVIFRGVEKGSAVAATVDPITTRATTYVIKL